MQYVLCDAEYAFVDDLKKTIRSWIIIFERFKLKFKDCPLATKEKLQRCYGYKTNKIKKEQGVASSSIESGDSGAESRKRKKPSTKKREALPADESIDESTSTDGVPEETIALLAQPTYSKQMIASLILENDAFLVRLEDQTVKMNHLENELKASQTAYTDLFEDTQATINRAVKDALDAYKTTELFKAMGQAAMAAQVTSCDNP